MPLLVRPIVRLFFPCEHAYLEEGKWTLKNPLHTLPVESGGAEVHMDIWLYAQLTEGAGSAFLWADLEDEAEYTVSSAKAREERHFRGGLEVVEEVFHLAAIPFSASGLYKFRLLANGEKIAETFIRVLPGPRS